MLFLPPHESSWTPPQDLPRLSDAKVLALDTETFDPNLSRKKTDPKKRPGWMTRDGYLVGVSLATPEQAWYFPIQNALDEPCPWGRENVMEWLRDTLGTDTPKVGANLTYDIGWLGSCDVPVGGSLNDVQFAESLLTDTGHVALDHLGKKYLGGGKESPQLYRWCSDAYGGEPDHKQRANIYRAPQGLVGPYAESDARLPLEILHKQWPLLARDGLLDVYDMECRLIQMMVAMRRQGVRVDVEKAHHLYTKLTAQAEHLLMELAKIAGREVSVNSPRDMGFLADKLGIPYNLTPTGLPQFQSGWLKEHPNPVMQTVLEARQLLKLTGTFLKGYIIDANVDGIVYGEFHQLKADENGAKTGRFSSSGPNLQNIPSRSELGKLVRSLFIPFDGHDTWLKADYSQIEYRCLAHWATGRGADALRAAYVADPKIDYHDRVQNQVEAVTGLRIERGPIKNINFGLVYGMGLYKLALQLGIGLQQAKEMMAGYHRGAPYVRDTMQATMSEAQEKGFITTILGRRTRFDTWVPKGSKDYEPLMLREATRRYGSVIERAWLYKALNYRLQGSAGEIIKKAMVAGWESGLFKRFQLPSVTVHDELGISYSKADTPPALLRDLRDCMEYSTRIAVPVIVDMEAGPSWGEVEEIAA